MHRYPSLTPYVPLLLLLYMTTSSKSPNSLKTVLIKLEGIKEYLGAPSMSHTETLQEYNKNRTQKTKVYPSSDTTKMQLPYI
ncbi:hypothetical protein M0802_007169 [Mischocyttarus mexicanus]|nr:hypothetical protein M0802_007169 [Mischocyttarus mexicanus]